MNKKQIVFVEPRPTVNAYRIARALKLTGKYETILICFSEVNKEFYSNAYNKISVLELNHKIKFKSLVDFFKKILNKKGKSFFKNIKEMRPYIFQITGPDLFSLMTIFILKKKIPKVYYANDIWGVEKRSCLFKKYGLKGEFQRICERICFRMVDGILNKHAYKQFELIDYDIPIPKISFHPDPLDEWTFSPKKKNDKDIHIVYGGNPQYNLIAGIPFLEIVKIITSQKIHFHSYGDCVDEKENLIFIKESKENKYYHFHKQTTPYLLNKEMNGYDYSILPGFWSDEEIKENPGITETEMCTKMTNYIESGLPIIVSNQSKYQLDIVEKHGIGFGIDFEDLKSLGKILKRKNYKQMQRNLKKYQEKFKLSNSIKEVEDFYEKIIKEKSLRLSK